MGVNHLDKAITLHTSPDLYPYYETCDPIRIPATAVNTAGVPTLTLSYQYALFTGGKFARWEDSSAPRTLHVARPPLDDKLVGIDGGDSEEELVMLVSDTLRQRSLSPTPTPTP
eukprot:CAMPEP_0118655312 /NCGR_PEP_ID=MMETSP0785-20121206/12857_1 /TAXON_ID=91992 /ORGANISM="Bolidomonas pacifica, Strain CCMP 1866" /LENGTH=113 /DNA_ID=CAMNT_0006548033 /DNA_START=194 /DNA_END=531 /DNA_ORIENTATION=-